MHGDSSSSPLPPSPPTTEKQRATGSQKEDISCIISTRHTNALRSEEDDINGASRRTGSPEAYDFATDGLQQPRNDYGEFLLQEAAKRPLKWSSVFCYHQVLTLIMPTALELAALSRTGARGAGKPGLPGNGVVRLLGICFVARQTLLSFFSWFAIIAFALYVHC